MGGGALRLSMELVVDQSSCIGRSDIVQDGDPGIGAGTDRICVAIFS